MNLELDGKRALVTGSSKGLGLAIAQALQAAGCQVAVNGRNANAVEAALPSVQGSVAAAGDVSVREGAEGVVATVVAELGGLDVLVCNAGTGRSVPPGDETLEEWQRVFALNLWSVTNSVEAARVELAKSGGSVTCVSSICGIETIPGAPATYSAAKAALNSYVSSISRPLARDGVRINAVAPGNLMFEGSTWAERTASDPARTSAMLEEEVPANRFGSAEEIADLVVFLSSPRAAFATGSVWTCDGGQTRSVT